ncbi:POTRA domain-containing protein [uncultured Psychroserpens sp.]|uniref:POTRA domain-containing protein n=1 Tax=uncultured Psychroserpens sp. TaxID=255436 RepID=UPI00260D3FB3|nr:POTRA domain-containing protein [uncultured Psychroserpens sp.]
MPFKLRVYKLIFLMLFFANLNSQNIELKVIGKSNLETKVIDSLNFKKAHKNFTSLNSEVLALEKKLQTLGYIDSELIKLEKENDSLFLAQFSLKNRFETITIYYNNIINSDIFKLSDIEFTDSYFVVPIKNLEKTLEFINSEIANNGSPFATLQLKEITKESKNTLVASLELVRPAGRTIDKVIVKGYEKFPKSFIRRYLKIKPKQNFNLKRIKEKTNVLNDLRFANQIKDPEVLFTKDSTILYMYIEKNKSNSFDGFLGFGTNEDTNKIEFDGYLNLILTNNLNYGETLRLLYKSDENDQKTFDGNINMPYLFASPLGVELNLNIFKKDSSFVTVSQAAKINYQLDPNNSIAVGINTVNSSNLLDDDTFLINDFKSNKYLINYIHTRRQNYDFLFPVNFLFDISAGIGNRTFEDTNENQTKFTINSFKIFNLNDRNSIYTRVNGQLINSNTYLENELPRFGGINSIRGFEENSLFANLFGVINTEYRYRLNGNIYVHSVIDAAYFENEAVDQKGKLFGFGFGFGLLTKAGLFKFNYSSGKVENQKFKLSDSKVHISLTANF